MLKHSRIVLGMLAALCGPAAAQIVPIIGDRQPDAALTIKIGDGTLSAAARSLIPKQIRQMDHEEK